MIEAIAPVVPKVVSYIDPGTGSLILQIVVAWLFVSLVMIKVYWGKVKGILMRIFSKKGRDGDK